jgi:hypothetical protein
MQDEPLRLVLCQEDLYRIGRHRVRWRHLGQRAAIWTAKLQLAVGPAFDLTAFLVDGTVVAATQQREVGQRRGSALGPVSDVMALAEADPAAWEAAAPVSILERAP